MLDLRMGERDQVSIIYMQMAWEFNLPSQPRSAGCKPSLEVPGSHRPKTTTESIASQLLAMATCTQHHLGILYLVD